MESFVDREIALKYIDDAITTLRDKKRLLRTPIIDFYGIGGIGKTFLLKRVQQQCQDELLRNLWIDANQSIATFSNEIVRQVQQYVTIPFEDSDTHLIYGPITALRILLQRGPVVMLFDSIDTSNREQLNWLEALLHNLSDENHLFVMLTSKRAISFENDRSLARKLTLFPLQPFDRSACEAYLNAIGDQSNPEIRDTIFQWTLGYPLALNVVVKDVASGLDLNKKPDQKEIITHLTHQVLDQTVLVRVAPAEHNWYQTMLSLLSVPRHFNLIVMQDLIEKFTPELSEENSLAYFGLPRKINQKTDAVNWNMTGTGFSVDPSVRSIFLLKLKIEQPDTYYAIHLFLAQTNKQLAADVSGADRVRYLQEYLYHSASAQDTAMLPRIFADTMQEIAKESSESFQLFADELSQDEELREALGKQVHIMESLIRANQLSEG